MRTAWVIGLWGTIVLASSGLPGQETFNENADDNVEGRGRVVGSEGVPEAGGMVTGSSTSAPSGSAANRWRYRFNNGHWWYYDRGNRWSYWNGAAWTPYDRQTYAQWFDGRFGGYGPDGRKIQRENNAARGAKLGSQGRRPPLTVQRQKNEPQGGGFGVNRHRPPLTVQHEKNEPRGGNFGGSGRRPPLTIQHQKNSPRGDED